MTISPAKTKQPRTTLTGAHDRLRLAPIRCNQFASPLPSPRQRLRNRLVPALLAVFASLVPVAAQAEPAGDILPIWRQIFARPQTGLSAIPAPPNNPMTAARVRLGEKLFHDPRLSGDGTRSCATCHDANRGYTDGRKRAAPIDGTTRLANTPSLVNLAWAERFFWDGRVESLEAQAAIPIEHPQEMGGTWTVILARLASDPVTAKDFRKAFPDNPVPTRESVVEALAAFERSLVSDKSRFDEFIAGRIDALSEIEKTGFTLFVGKAGCVSCHNGWRLTDDRLHRTGRSTDPVKTPTLRGLALTGPYMHDGELASIGDVIDHYQNLSADDLSLSPSLVRPLGLNDDEKAALIAFIRTLD